MQTHHLHSVCTSLYLVTSGLVHIQEEIHQLSDQLGRLGFGEQVDYHPSSLN